MRKKATQRDCSGCRDDFYNGHNELGVKQCWALKDAVIVPRLLIPINVAPPYKGWKPRTVPNCYHMERHATVKPESIDSNGDWK